MAVETAVLIGNEHRDEARIDIARVNRKPPASVRRREGPQKTPVSIDDDARALACGGKIGLIRRRPEMKQGRGNCEAGHSECKKERCDRTKMSRVKHFIWAGQHR
jgi:hypothetical protein